MHRVFSKELPQAALAHFESHDCHLQQLGAAKGVTCSLHKSCGHDEFCAMLTSRLRQEALFPECLDLSFPVISCFFFRVFPCFSRFRNLQRNGFLPEVAMSQRSFPAQQAETSTDLLHRGVTRTHRPVLQVYHKTMNEDV